jgi:hypothetical protein
MSVYVDPVLVGAQPAPWGYLATLTGPTRPVGFLERPPFEAVRAIQVRLALFRLRQAPAEILDIPDHLQQFVEILDILVHAESKGSRSLDQKATQVLFR